MKHERKLHLENGSTITVKRLQLYDFAIALKKIQKIPTILSEISGKSSDEIFQILPKAIGENLEEFADIVATATDYPKEKVMEMSLVDFMAVVKAILEVNSFEEIRSFLSTIGQLVRKDASPTKPKKS